MAKIPFNDVTPPDKRSIRNIPIPSGRRKKVGQDQNFSYSGSGSYFNNKSLEEDQQDTSNIQKESSPVEQIPEQQKFVPKMSDIKTSETRTSPEKTSNPNNNVYEYYYPKNIPSTESKKPKSNKKYIWGGLALLAICGFVVGMMNVFSSATVKIVPKSQSLTVDMTLPVSAESEEGSVKYEVIKTTKSNSVSVEANGEESVELKASGKIVIYNTYSTEPQKLIIRTRFETKDGLIFRIPESIVVPGMTTKDGKTVPGSIEVTVYADEAGEKYNIDKTDFTIPGFKSDAKRYAGFYARSSTDITGGFVGKRKTVSDEQKTAALQKLDSDLQTDLQKDLQSKVPDGLVLLQNGIIYENKEPSQTDDGSTVTFTKEMTAYGITLNKSNLAKYVTDKYLPELKDWANISATINDFSGIEASNLSDKLKNQEKSDINIKGVTKLIASIDSSIISQKLLGQPKKAGDLRSEFPGIDSITVSISPVWKNSFPTDSSKIHIDVSDE